MIDLQHPGYFYTREGVRIFFIANFKKAEGPVIVFNYGLACNINHYKFQIPYFQQRGFNILIHDYRFHYSSSGTDDFSDCTFIDMVDDIHQLLRHLKIQQSVFVGHSMGVNVSLEFAVRYPELVLGMVLVSGSVFPHKRVSFDLNIVEVLSPLLGYFAKNHPRALQSFWTTQFMNPLARFIIARGGFNVRKVSDEFIQVYMKKIGEIAPAVFIRLINEIKDHNIFPRLEDVKTPALVIGGGKDYVIPPHLQNMLHQYLSNSQLCIIEDGSHVPQVDFHEVVNQRMESFLDGLI